MIVVAIIGILAAIALPAYSQFACRSRQTEAKAVLKAIYVAEEAYRGEFDTYVGGTLADLLIIGIDVAGDPERRYDYSVVTPGATATTFDSFASGIVGGSMELDAWEGSHLNNIDNTSNRCAAQ